MKAPRVLAVIYLLFSCRALLATIIVPPWQNPDEPAHFARVRLFERYGTDAVPPPGSERDIVQSMRHFDWWRYVQAPTPEILPDSPADVTSAGGGPTVYYVVAGGLLRILGPSSLLPQFYLLRALSGILALLTVWCAWLGSRNLFDAREAVLVPAVLALHPQFVLVSTSVSPDAAVNLCGAVVWWQATVLLTGRGSAVPLIVMAASGVAAPFIRRSGTPLLAMVLVTWLLSVSRVFSGGWRYLREFMLVMVALGLAGFAAFLVFRQEVFNIIEYTRPILQRGVHEETGWDDLLPFSSALFDSSWLFAGWMRYPAPFVWMLVARIVSLIGLLGLLLAARAGGLMRRHPSAFFATVACVSIQLAAEYYWHFRLHIGPQGRYIFPAIVPAIVLLWTGWRAWWPERYWRDGAVLLLLLIGFLDLTAWVVVLIPAFRG